MARDVKNKEGFVIQGVSVCTFIAIMHMKLWEHVSFKKTLIKNGYNDVVTLSSSWRLHHPTCVLI